MEVFLSRQLLIMQKKLVRRSKTMKKRDKNGLQELIVESGKRMAGSGLTVETWGNISYRDPETQLVYLTPRAMLRSTR